MDGLIERIKSDVLPIVSRAAPLLASVLGSPLAGVGVALLSNLFGVDSRDIDSLSKAIAKDPEAAIKIKTLEYEHAEMLAKIASTDYSTEVDDRKNARAYGFQYKDFMRHMAYLVTIGFFLAIFALFLPVDVTPDEKNLLSMLIGMLASKWQTIIDFFFGSSRHKKGVSK